MFTHLLAELNHSFSIIGLTETKFQFSGGAVDKCFSSYGGAMFFVSNKLNYATRNDFSDSKPDHDALWLIEVELENELHHEI